MAKSFYLINPREPVPGYFGLEASSQAIGGLKVLVADLTTTTVAALMPSDWRVALCDERLELVDLDCDANVIGITGKMSQRDSMIELAALYRARGKLVVIGGPYATLNPDDIAPHCDILVKGEIEEIAA